MLVQNAIPLQGDRAVLSKCWVTEEEGVTFPKFRQDEELKPEDRVAKGTVLCAGGTVVFEE
jgi:hypothetical protein